MSPSMQARVDDTRFQSGFAEDTKNMLVHSNGSIQRRPGLRHVAACKFANKKCRLLRFAHSIDTQIVIELGDLYFRFHENGAPIYYAKPYVVASIDTGQERITFTQRHDLTNETQVQFTADSGLNAHLPGGVTAGTSYYVTVIDKKTITVSTTTPAGTPLNLTSAGTGTIRVFRNSEMPADWASVSFTFGTVNVDRPNNTITIGAHSFPEGQAVRFSLDPIGGLDALPAPFIVARNYYVRAPGATTIRLVERQELAPIGPSIDIVSVGNGTNTVLNAYQHGELVFHQNGTNHGVFYAKNDVGAIAGTPPTADPTNWLLMRQDGLYELPNPYLEADLAAITYDPDNDTLTLARRNYDVSELRRYSAQRWTFKPIQLGPSVNPPTTLGTKPIFGDYITFSFPNIGNLNPTPPTVPALFTMKSAGVNNQTGHGFVLGDSVFAEGTPAGSGATFGGNTADYFIVSHTGAPNPGQAHLDLRLRKQTGGAELGSTSAGDCIIRYSSLSSQATNRYQITSVTEDGIESQPSAIITISNNDLSVAGSSNDLFWEIVVGASYFHVYKELNGLFSLLAKVELDSTAAYTGTDTALIGSVMMFYRDDNSLLPDAARTVPIFDATLGGAGNGQPVTIATQHPAATTHYEQRRFFGGTAREPQTVWATRTGTETDLSFRQPTLPDDRINAELKSREAVSIRHLVPIEQLLILTNSTEFRLIPVNSDVLTPTSLDAKAHDYVGASTVSPSVLSGNVIYCADRGGHVFEIGFRQDGLGLSKPGDLCLRSNSLFDHKTILDQIAVKAPQPIIFFVSSDGRLLGITYVPQEQIGAWHVHDTPGTFESIAFASEGTEDHLYATVLRTLNGSTSRTVERLGRQQFSSLRESYFGDCGGTYDGRNTDLTKTATITGGVFWTAGEMVTITMNAPQFVLGAEDVGDEIALWEPSAPETLYRIRITVVSSGTVATGTLQQALPVALRTPAAVTSWGFARDAIALPWLQGEEVEIMADGVELEPVTVTGGLATLPSPGLVVQVGLLAEAELHSLPLSQQVEALAQGRPKNVNRTFIKVLDSGGFSLGPTTDSLVPSSPQPEPGEVLTEEIDTTVMPSYSQGGELVLRAGKMQPLAVLGWVFDVEIAG